MIQTLENNFLNKNSSFENVRVSSHFLIDFNFTNKGVLIENSWAIKLLVDYFSNHVGETLPITLARHRQPYQ